MDELQVRDITAPVLLRFPDILDNRVEKISRCFKLAAEQYNFTGDNFLIYPIKVNQMRPVVEEIVTHGKKFNIGLEAGSKPELHAVLATNIVEDALIICNGYKDANYIELALLAQKMGRRIYLVVEKLNELKLIAEIATRPTFNPTLESESSSLHRARENGRKAVATSRNSDSIPPSFFKLSISWKNAR